MSELDVDFKVGMESKLEALTAKLVPFHGRARNLHERQGCENEQQNEGVRHAEW